MSLPSRYDVIVQIAMDEPYEKPVQVLPRQNMSVVLEQTLNRSLVEVKGDGVLVADIGDYLARLCP